MASGYLNLVLHAHLPYIKHLRYRDHIEQRWFYEAVVESYLPLADTLLDLHGKGVEYHITLSLSPTLCVMLHDDDLKDGCEAFMGNLIELCEHECRRNQRRPRICGLSTYYLNHFRRMRELYTNTYRRDLLSVFRKLSDEGRVTLMTSSVTHAYLPLFEDYPEAVTAQIKGGLQIFRKYIGIEPNGFWLPECGYTPEIEKVLGDLHIDFTVLESHGIMYARPLPRFGIVRPVFGPYGVMLFGRDAEVSRLVWSAESGYPADAEYRDFHDDASFELSDNDVRRFIHPDGMRVPSGIKYRKISGNMKKDVYEPEKAFGKLDLHSSHFVQSVSEVIARAGSMFGVEPIITVAFDAELFGHWWHEGCGWLERVLERCSRHPGISMTSGRDGVPACNGFDTVTPETSSWGSKGYHETWINPNNDWIIRLVHRATEKIIRIARHHKREKDRRMLRALNVAARELLMLQASDWSFMLSRDIVQTYARSRVENHYTRILEIVRMIETRSIDQAYLNNVEDEEGEFTETDYRWFCGSSGT